jgi:gliding motility associated protien GldN
MKKLFLSLFLVATGLIPALNLSVKAQENNDQYNPNSVEPIAKYEHLFKVRVWRVIDLQERHNKGFFAKGGEITKLIMNAVESGELSDIYETDSLDRKMSKEDFIGKLQFRQAANYDEWTANSNWYDGDVVTYNGKNYVAIFESRGKNPETSPNEWQPTTMGKAVNFLPNQIKLLEIVEDIIFDKRRSRLYYDIQAVRPIVPSSENYERNINQPLGWFKYKDLVEVFRNHPDDAIWFNRNNTAENKNFEDAFKLRLFRASIFKVENPEDETIYDRYVTGSQRPYIESVWAREWEEMKLMEREHNLWEF